MSLALVLFWLSVAALAYGYLGFPALLALVGALRDRRVSRGPVTPDVSILIAAYDEEAGIAERVRNALDADYPPERLEVVVASDGSTDATVSRAVSVGSGRVRVLDLPREGKAAALSAAARTARGEILVFSDANTRFERGTVRSLVRNFADPEVGGVVGHTGYHVSERVEAAGRGESLYWRYDTWLKEMESRTGSVVSAHGGLYGIRRALFEAPDPAVTDDFAISTGVVARGYRLVFDADARGWEEPATRSAGEFRRRVRLMSRGLRGVLLRRGLLDPFRHGFYALALFSHKVLRRLLALVLPVLFVSSWALAGRGSAYLTVALGQTAMYVAAGAGALLRDHPRGRHPALYVPFFYVLANVAAIIAFWNLLTGRRIARWTPQRGGETAPSVAAPMAGHTGARQ